MGKKGLSLNGCAATFLALIIGVGLLSIFGLAVATGNRSCGVNRIQGVVPFGNSVPDLEGSYRSDDGTELSYDLYLPKDADNVPLVVYIHGGGWSSGTKELPPGFAPLKLCDRGYAVASIEYRLTSDGFTWPTPALDVMSALVHLQETDFGDQVDSSQMAVFGASAGGHLALFAANAMGEVSIGPDATVRVHAVISAAGPTDFTDPALVTVAEQTAAATEEQCSSRRGRLDARCLLSERVSWPCVGDPGEAPCTNVIEHSALRLLGCQPGHVRGCGEVAAQPLAADASPISWVDPCDPPHMLLADDAPARIDDDGWMVGDPLVPPDQTSRMLEALERAGVDHEASIWTGGGHFADQGRPEVIEAMDAFLERSFAQGLPCS